MRRRAGGRLGREDTARRTAAAPLLLLGAVVLVAGPAAPTRAAAPPAAQRVHDDHELGPAAGSPALAPAIGRRLGPAAWPRPQPSRPARPDAGLEVRAGDDLQAALERVPAGGAVLLAPGVHQGPLRIARPVTLWGPAEAVVRSSGSGTTVEVLAAGVELLGFTVEGSGRRFDLTDAAISVRADDVRLEGLTLRDALFGITVERARRVRIRGNAIWGTGEPDLGLRGDAIRFWEVRDSEIAGNLVGAGRDIVVWYSPGNVLRDNFVESGRYGAHLMYSHANRVLGNTFTGNLVGVFVMYSDSVEVRANRMAFSDPTGGMGLGVKESGELLVVDNLFLANQDGVYLDASPLRRGHWNHFERNAFLFCGAGAAFHRSGASSRFVGNQFRDCGVAVRIDGGGDVLRVIWEGNHFDDYQGYDLDRDGVGDVPYELHRLSDQLTSTREELRFFRGTPALALLDLVGRVVPLLAPRVILRDSRPRFGAPGAPAAGASLSREDARAH